ncbi:MULTISPECIES: hypothetical protein [unclassified Breznakia]|uniref:type IV toxin-antitoxin system AbiEi family antitoxin domain-containing protein n=1 Tax=unclassified Breznakia TaxID=2623764 RepID=UPI0024754F18|nr:MULTISPECIES: hypothetical protein [unclassified Breznakia]MDH6367625.1 putative transcriptional regulator of viral defense system [Breznakia sp. PH1-1]MDH6403975.1 putative transcriptional regulator of viral defense system [Breznakia sp. PF1-11]MDH6411684.1 putative transcriptional regulator of viral defense system [Breznakia sp. PFB1-11]MDH6414754.1 putative transcriptional regulator of viral defense system [Breznakia sp. PFB1-14]MDH6416035.1 putative transcriptional regulator of viral de
MNKLKEILDMNHGVVTFSQVKEEGVPYHHIRTMLMNKELENDIRGFYHKPNVYVDELYILQYRYPKGIYALETALWLHGVSLVVPFEPIMCFSYGTNTKIIKKAGIKPVIARSYYNDGIEEIKTPSGQKVLVYNVERTLVECLREIYKIDIQVIAPAFKAYAAKGEINYAKLVMYAKRYKVEKKVQAYLEVL